MKLSQPHKTNRIRMLWTYLPNQEKVEKRMNDLVSFIRFSNEILFNNISY